MNTETLGGVRVTMPELEQIPMPKTKAALEKALIIAEKRREATRERDAADDAARDAGNLDLSRLGEAFFADPDAVDDNPSVETQTARKRKDDAQARLSGFGDAEAKALAALREALAFEGDAWGKIAVSDTKKAITKLVTAAKMAAQARDDLGATIGVLGMLRNGSLQVTEGLYSVELDMALGSLHAAIQKVDLELKALS